MKVDIWARDVDADAVILQNCKTIHVSTINDLFKLDGITKSIEYFDRPNHLSKFMHS